MKKNKGFTLIELLVVIAIIGILTSIILASLSTARARAGDAALKSQMNAIRTQAEIVYEKQGSYLTVCGAAGTVPWDADIIRIVRAMARYTVQPGMPTCTPSDANCTTVTAAANDTKGMRCLVPATGQSYVMTASMKGATNEGTWTAFCIDSKGVAKTTTVWNSQTSFEGFNGTECP